MKTLYTTYNNFAKRLVMSLIVLMTVGVGSAFAQDEIVYTLTSAATGTNSSPHNAYASPADWTYEGITWNVTGNSYMVPWRIGGKSLSNADRVLYSKTAITDDISKIVITHGTSSSGITVNSMKVIVSTAQNGGGTVISTLTPTFKANGDVTITRPDGKDWSKAFYKIVYNVTVSASKNNYIEFTSAKFYKTNAPACSYIVTFNSNYGTNATSSQEFRCDETKALTANSFSRTGYTFAGWSTTSNGSVVYTNGQSVSNLTSTNNGTIPLYAQWTPNKYKVEFNGNGNTGGSMSDQSFTYGTAQNLTANAFEKYGYRFAGWSKTSNGSVAYTDGQLVSNLTSTNNGTVTLYAQWTEKDLTNYRTSCTTETTYSVTYNENGATSGNVPTDANSPYKENAEITVLGNTGNLAKTGYTFSGWNTEANGTGTTYTAGETFTITENTTLYAQWEAIPYTITFLKQWGNGGTDNATVTFNSNNFSVVTIELPTRDGYEFGGYYTETGGAGLQIVDAEGKWLKNKNGYLDASGNWIKAESVNLYAKWTKIHTITWVVNNNTETPHYTSMVLDGNTIDELPNAPADDLFEDCEVNAFVGWSTDNIGLEPDPTAPTDLFKTLSEAQSKIGAINGDKKFYAVYASEIEQIATFEADGLNGLSANSTLKWTHDNSGISLAISAGQRYTGSPKTFTITNGTSNYCEIVAPEGKSLKKAVVSITESNYKVNSVSSPWSLSTSSTTQTITTSTNATDLKMYATSSYQIRITQVDVTYTTYSNYITRCTALPDPVWGGATIDKTEIAVNCGETSSTNGAAKISFLKATNYNLYKDIAVEVTSGNFIIATSRDGEYSTSVTLTPTQSGTNVGTLDGKYVYVRAVAPAMSDEDFTGTITLSGKQLAENQVINVTADVTCATYTLTLDDRGTKITAEYYAGASVPKPADPTGVCTDPINYVFDGWATSTVAGGSTSYTKVSFPYTMPAKATTLYAVYRYTEGNTDSDKFMSVDKGIGELVSGVDYVLTGYNTDDKEYALSCTQYESGKYKTKQIDVSESTTMYDEENPYYELTTTDNEIIWTITGDDENGYSFQNKSTGKYLNIEDGSLALNNSDPTKYTIEHYVGYDSELGKYVQYLNVIIQPLEDYLYYLSSYYKNSTAGVLFNLHSSSTLQLYLYKRAAATLYTTSPACGPMLEITSGKDIYVTSGYGTGRNTVIAQQTVEYRATRLKTQNGSAGGKAPDVKVTANGITIGGEVTDKVKVVELTQNKELIGDKYTITGTVTIQYTPKANHLQEEIQVQLAVDYNSEAKDNFTVHARSLPAEFVIAAKQGDKWYALNGDMSGNDAEKANGYLQVDDIEDPTKATFAPCNTIYTFDGMVDGGNKEYMRFQGIDGKYLWAASAGNTGIQNYAKNTPTAVTTLYNWQLYTSDNETYQLQNEGNGRKLGLSKDLNFGMYSYVSTLQQDIRILPIEAKCIYNYAPTNLKVSVLKSTSVTLTWDAVAGATKYQYRTDATSWTDAGTEPTVTISGLSKGTDYTYYIRAYHEDAGVSQECIDYAEITFTTADCDDVPTNITYTADLNSITVSWTAAAPTATITYNTKEDGTGGGGTINNATSPYKISGGLDKNTTYYIQILAGGSCASPIIPVKTEDVEVDIVEWYPQGIIVDINTDETVGVTLENEVSYGSGMGTEATELFFSKYYEASYNVKLVAIYNGTKNIIDLTDYTIQYGKTSWESNYITLKDFGATKGQIQPGEEIILYSYTENDTDDKKILDCVHEHYPDGNWVRVTSSNNDGKGTLSFGGDKTIILCKTEYDEEEDKYYDNIIDVIGALKNDPNEGILPTNTATKEPSWGDKEGWVCETGLSIADDSQIGISTNRCLLIRNNTVTSGDNAVASNMNDFVTLCTEWKGAQVPDNNIDNGVQASCDNFAYVGNFDYSDYYTKYETMGDERVFDENARNADGTVTIPITDLYEQSCRNIRIKLSNSNGDVLTDREYKVPIMITTTQGTDGQAFLDLQQNLATVEVDGSGNPTGNKTNLTLEQVREICKTCDVVVRDNATLMKKADDAANDHPQVRNIYVYENSSLIVPNGTNYTINNLSLRRNQDAVASVSAYPTALKLPESAAAPISLDFRLSAESWHWFTLPYECNINEVTWADGTPAQYNTDWYLMTYDGEKRAETQAGGCWKAYTSTTINAGDGFIIAINGNINNPAHTYELHFPMSKEVLAAEETDKTVAVRAWGVETNIRPNHKGWNLVGNPYLDYYQRNNITNFEGLRLGQLTGPDPQTGYWEQTGDVPYVVVPVGAGWIAYEQVLASETDLLPFTAYFVQVGNDGTHNSSQDLKVSFDHTKLQLSATPMPASIVRRAPSEVNETEEPVIVGVALTNSLGESDKTSLVIADRFTNEYEMQADFFKWFGDYYNYYTKPVLYTIGADQGKRAFNALNEELAAQPIPMGMYAAQAGNYTFSLNQQFDLSRVEEVWLYDAIQSTYTNLMQSDYTFSTSKVNGAGRFSLSVKLAPKVATSIDNVTADKVWATTHTKQVIVNGLENGMHLWLYDATGKLLYNEPTSNYQHTYSVPQTGTYFVSVMNGNQKQTIKVVVE